MPRILMASCILFCLLGFAIKAVSVANSQPSADPNAEAFERIRETRLVSDATVVGRGPLVRGGSYSGFRVVVPGCGGSAVVVPIKRAGEIDGLRALLGGTSLFVVGRRTYAEFPFLEFQLIRLANRLGLNGLPGAWPFLLNLQTGCKETRFLRPPAK